MKHSYLKSLSRLLILVMALLPLQSVAVSVDMTGSGTQPCSVMGSISIEQGKMDMEMPCQMDMASTQSCANCDFSSVAIFLLTTHRDSVVRNRQPVSALSIQFTTNTPPLRFAPRSRPPLAKPEPTAPNCSHHYRFLELILDVPVCKYGQCDLRIVP